MNYSADTLKKEYKKNTDVLRAGNLRNLRENIAKLSLSDFSRQTGMTKNDISHLENGEKTLSLTHMLTYKKYFSENHRINLSMDYLMGFTDIIENNNINYQKEIGLSDRSLKTLIEINKLETPNNALNKILADKKKAMALLYNIELVISNEQWYPGIVSCFTDKEGKTSKIANSIEPTEDLAFYNLNGGVLAIDERILRSHAMLTIQDILSKYRQE